MIEKRKYPAIALQTWSDIFFMHWRVEPESLRQYVKPPYELDIFDGSAWISVVCFMAKNSRLRFIPFDFVTSAIQTNVRTYVRLSHRKNSGRPEPGVYFLKLLLNNRFAVNSARLGLSLPFQYVTATMEKQGHLFTYKSVDERETKLHVSFYSVEEGDSSDLANFLTERYAIWHHKGNRLVKIPISHAKWQITRAKASIFTNHTHPLIQGRQPDIVHAADEKLTHLYPYEIVGLFSK